MPGESDAAGAVREVREEASIAIVPDSATWRAALTFLFPAQPQLNAVVTVFFGQRWNGQVQDSEEIAPQWFDVDSLPLDQM